MAYAYVRVERVRNDTRARDPEVVSSAYHEAMKAHGRGKGALAVMRRRADATCRGIAACVGSDGQWLERRTVAANDESEPRLKIGDAWLHHVKAHGAGIRANANMALHLLVGVSPEWVEEAGRLHDSENPRNVDLFEHAIEWARGAGLAPYAARLDLDEKGGGEVDLFCAPIRQQGRRNSRRNFVAVTQALNEIGSKHKQYRSYSGLQDSWHQYAVRHLSSELERGEPKAETKREHLSPERYGELMDECAARGEQEIRRMLAEARRRNRNAKRREAAVRLASKAVRQAKRILDGRGEEGQQEAELLSKEAVAAVDGDDEAVARLDQRYRSGTLDSERGRGRTHSRD